MIQKHPKVIDFCKYCDNQLKEEREESYNCVGSRCNLKFETFKSLQNHMLCTHSRKLPCSNCSIFIKYSSECRFCKLPLKNKEEYQCVEGECNGLSFKFKEFQHHSFFKHELEIRCLNCPKSQSIPQCTICRQFVTNGKILAHMKQKHVKEMIADKGWKKEFKMVKLQRCPLCMKLVSIEKGMKHLSRKHLPVLKLKRIICCPACKFVTDSFRKLEKHSSKKHMPRVELDDFLKLL